MQNKLLYFGISKLWFCCSKNRPHSPLLHTDILTHEQPLVNAFQLATGLTKGVGPGSLRSHESAQPLS